MSKLDGKSLDPSSHQGQTRSSRAGQSKRAGDKLKKTKDTTESKQTKSKLKLKTEEKHRGKK